MYLHLFPGRRHQLKGFSKRSLTLSRLSVMQTRQQVLLHLSPASQILDPILFRMRRLRLVLRYTSSQLYLRITSRERMSDSCSTGSCNNSPKPVKAMLQLRLTQHWLTVQPRHLSTTQVSIRGQPNQMLIHHWTSLNLPSLVQPGSSVKWTLETTQTASASMTSTTIAT